MNPLPAIIAFVALSSALSFAADPRPNIILMMGDDHGWEETGYNGHPHVKTPVLDEMAATGLRFDRFYAAHPEKGVGPHYLHIGSIWAWVRHASTVAH